MYINEILPWHQVQWQQLVQRRQRNSLPHAVLLTGPTGLGKRLFAEQLAAALLCNQPQADGHACGQCKGCQLMAAGSHPDFYPVGPEEDSRYIRIHQIRALSEKMAGMAQLSGYRVTIVDPADSMNASAANSLLKTLEEPGEQAMLILVASQPGLLAATIRSRCQQLQFAPPPLDQGINWLEKHNITEDSSTLLKLTGNAPLAALSAAEEQRLASREQFLSDFFGLKKGVQNPVAMADKWNKSHPEWCIHWMMSWVMDLIKLKSTSQPDTNGLVNADKLQHLQPMANTLDLSNLFSFLDKLQSGLGLLKSQVNPEHLFTDLFITWIRTR